MVPKLQKRKWLLLSVLASCSILSACQTKAPPTTPCIIDAQNQVLYCSPPNKPTVTITLEKADNFICWSADDVEALYNYIKRLEQKR